MTTGDPRQSVDSRLTMVDTWLLSLESEADGVAPVEGRPGLQAEEEPDTEPPAAAMRESSSSVSPCLARGAGSTPRRVNRSANEAKQRRAPSDTWRTESVFESEGCISEPAGVRWGCRPVTWWSSCFRRLDRDSTQVSREESCGSILLQRRDTTAIAECRVSLWTRWPLSRMKLKTQFRPLASNTAPDSLVQISSSTCSHRFETQTTVLDFLTSR